MRENLSSDSALRSNPGDSVLEESAFSFDHTRFLSEKFGGFTNSQLIAWFSADDGGAIPPCYLLDLVTTLAGADFLSTKGLGSKLIDEFGSIGGVLAADAGRLLRWLEMEGQTSWFTEQLHLRLKATAALMKQALAEEIKNRPLISSWQSLLEYLKFSLGNDSIEQLLILFLDKKNFLIKDEIQQKGTVDHTPLYPREIAKRSLELNASAIIMVHNHPSGDPTPSRADIEMTKQVEAALTPLRIVFHDHLIIGSEGHLSFKAEGLM